MMMVTLTKMKMVNGQNRLMVKRILVMVSLKKLNLMANLLVLVMRLPNQNRANQKMTKMTKMVMLKNSVRWISMSPFKQVVMR